MRLLLVLLAIAVAFIVLGAILQALKLLLFLGLAVLVVGLVGSAARRGSR